MLFLTTFIWFHAVVVIIVHYADISRNVFVDRIESQKEFYAFIPSKASCPANGELWEHGTQQNILLYVYDSSCKSNLNNEVFQLTLSVLGISSLYPDEIKLLKMSKSMFPDIESKWNIEDHQCIVIWIHKYTFFEDQHYMWFDDHLHGEHDWLGYYDWLHQAIRVEISLYNKHPNQISIWFVEGINKYKKMYSIAPNTYKNIKTYIGHVFVAMDTYNRYMITDIWIRGRQPIIVIQNENIFRVCSKNNQSKECSKLEKNSVKNERKIFDYKTKMLESYKRNINGSRDYTDYIYFIPMYINEMIERYKCVYQTKLQYDQDLISSYFIYMIFINVILCILMKIFDFNVDYLITCSLIKSIYSCELLNGLKVASKSKWYMNVNKTALKHQASYSMYLKISKLLHKKRIKLRTICYGPDCKYSALHVTDVSDKASMNLKNNIYLGSSVYKVANVNVRGNLNILTNMDLNRKVWVEFRPFEQAFYNMTKTEFNNYKNDIVNGLFGEYWRFGLKFFPDHIHENTIQVIMSYDMPKWKTLYIESSNNYVHGVYIEIVKWLNIVESILIILILYYRNEYQLVISSILLFILSLIHYILTIHSVDISDNRSYRNILEMFKKTLKYELDLSNNVQNAYLDVFQNWREGYYGDETDFYDKDLTLIHQICCDALVEYPTCIANCFNHIKIMLRSATCLSYLCFHLTFSTYVYNKVLMYNVISQLILFNSKYILSGYWNFIIEFSYTFIIIQSMFYLVVIDRSRVHIALFGVMSLILIICCLYFNINQKSINQNMLWYIIIIISVGGYISAWMQSIVLVLNMVTKYFVSKFK